MTAQRTPASRNERLDRFKTDSPRAGEEFPEVTAQLLDGGTWSPSESAGRAIVLETGAFT